MDNIRK